MIKKTLGGKMRELTAEQIQKNYELQEFRQYRS